jgi:hypothetical protein
MDESLHELMTIDAAVVNVNCFNNRLAEGWVGLIDFLWILCAGVTFSIFAE